jgi:OOP family OmpA-OmpF porin
MKFLNNLFKVILLFSIFIQCKANFGDENNEFKIQKNIAIAPLGKIYEAHLPLQPPLSRITFYRPQLPDRQGVYTININGDYHASLQPGRYTNLCIQPMQVQLQAYQVENTKPRTPQTAQAVLDLNADKDTYIRVEKNGNAELSISIVENLLAQAELKNTRQQTHTISRVPQAKSCTDSAQELPEKRPGALQPDTPSGPLLSESPTPDPTPLADLKAPKTIPLDTGNYFNFSKSEIADMLPESRQKLSDAIARIKQELAHNANTQIHVIGYSDALGRPQRKKTVAAQRAQTIRNYLIGQGIPAQKITSEGRSDADPVAADCAQQISAASIACNQSNRRVLINLIGK